MRDIPSTSIEIYVLYSAIQVLLFKEGKEKNCLLFSLRQQQMSREKAFVVS